MITPSAIELLVKRVWYRSLARIQRIRSGSPGPSAIHTSPAARLPPEVVKEIVAYLINDLRSLRACSLTCYSWYIATVPHLHQMLSIHPDSWGRKLRWPNPLLYMHMLGLLPLVRTLWIHGENDRDAFSSKRLNRCILRQFCALNNVRQLVIDFLDIPSFMPKVRRYFGQFSPTVQYLSLREPRGSRRQIIYFIGLFQHLEDLELNYFGVDFQEEPVDDPTLIPLFAPPLRGSLVMACFMRVGLLKDMIELFGGIRFRQMSLWNVDGMRPLLDACAQTLETLRLYPTDPRGKDHSLNRLWLLSENFTVRSSPRDFDLSRNKSLQTFQVAAASIGSLDDDSATTALSFLKRTLSTITSPTFFQVMVIYLQNDFCGLEPRASRDQLHFREASQAERTKEAALHRRRFEILREAHKVRNFRLLLCAHVRGPVEEYSVRMLKEAVAEEKAHKGFDGFLSEPQVTYYPRGGGRY